MSDGKAFTERLAAHPGDEAARIAYANWLDEHGRTEEAAQQRRTAPGHRVLAVMGKEPWSSMGPGFEWHEALGANKPCDLPDDWFRLLGWGEDGVPWAVYATRDAALAAAALAFANLPLERQAELRAKAESRMSPDRAALLYAVLADPSDDTPRLVFADWMQEHGEEERAAFVRRQFADGPQLSEWPRDGAWMSYDEWPDSVGYLFYSDLRSPVHRHRFGYRWHRGWIDHVSLAAPVFFDRAELLFRTHPVEFVTLVDVRPQLHPAVAATVDLTSPADMALLPHVLVGVDLVHDALFESGTPLPVWELLAGHTEVDRGPDLWPRKTFPNRSHALEALSRACVRWGRELAELPLWNPPYRLI